MATTPKRERRKAARGFATRAEERRHRMHARLSAATTAGEQVAAAWDWWRMALAHDADPADRSRLMRDMAQHLADAADAVSTGRR